MIGVAVELLCFITVLNLTCSEWSVQTPGWPKTGCHCACRFLALTKGLRLASCTRYRSSRPVDTRGRPARRRSTLEPVCSFLRMVFVTVPMQQCIRLAISLWECPAAWRAMIEARFSTVKVGALAIANVVLGSVKFRALWPFIIVRQINPSNTQPFPGRLRKP